MKSTTTMNEKSGKFSINQVKFSRIFHKVSRFTISKLDFFKHFKGQFEGENNFLFSSKDFAASAVANRLTRHLSDLQIHNGLPCTVLEANFVIFGYVLRVSSQACRLVASTQQFIILSLTRVSVKDGEISTLAHAAQSTISQCFICRKSW